MVTYLINANENGVEITWVLKGQVQLRGLGSWPLFVVDVQAPLQTTTGWLNFHALPGLQWQQPAKTRTWWYGQNIDKIVPPLLPTCYIFYVLLLFLTWIYKCIRTACRSSFIGRKSQNRAKLKFGDFLSKKREKNNNNGRSAPLC